MPYYQQLAEYEEAEPIQEAEGFGQMDYVSLYREVAPGSLGEMTVKNAPLAAPASGSGFGGQLPPHVKIYPNGEIGLAPGWIAVGDGLVSTPVKIGNSRKFEVRLPPTCSPGIPTWKKKSGAYPSSVSGMGSYEDVNEMIASRMTAESAPDEAGKPNYLALTVMAAAIGGILYYGSSSRRSY